MAFDLIIRGGTIVDGSGLPGYRGDVGVKDGIIVSIGDLRSQRAEEVIDAEGHVVAPGFVDGHTHMDAQVFWDQLGTCSVWHGVTSVIMGNCGFSIAPCSEKDKALVLRNLERAEDIPRPAMEAGIPWSWTTYSEYLDAVENLPKGINYAGYVGHSALRTYVMGERAFTEKASQDDMHAMKSELEAGIRAGAVGFSTSRSGNHRTPEGRPVASRVGDWEEVCELTALMGRLGTGVLELSRDGRNLSDEEMVLERRSLKDLAVTSGVPLTFGSAWYHRATPDNWRDQFEMVDDTWAEGGRMLIQGTSSWNSSLRSFQTLMLFDRAPIWVDFRKLPLEQQESGLRDPAMRKKLVDAAKAFRVSRDPSLPNALIRDIDWDWIFPFDRPLPPYRSIGDIAREQHKDPVDCYIDIALENHLKMFFINPGNNEDQDFVLALIRHPRTAVTFSDSGAHVASTLNPVQTHLLGHWVRDKQAVTMESAIRKITHDVASFWGLTGRGMLRKGFFGDIVVFDPETVSPAMPYLVDDLPTGAQRILQKAIGIKYTVVNGQILLKDGDHTGRLPGKLLRNSKVTKH